jgi:hypothetical protein
MASQVAAARTEAEQLRLQLQSTSAEAQRSAALQAAAVRVIWLKAFVSRGIMHAFCRVSVGKGPKRDSQATKRGETS